MFSQVYNKVDQISIEEVDRLARRPHSVVIRSDICVHGDKKSLVLLDALYAKDKQLLLLQLWNEPEPGLSPGEAVGILVTYLPLYQEKRRYPGSSSPYCH